MTSQKIPTSHGHALSRDGTAELYRFSSGDRSLKVGGFVGFSSRCRVVCVKSFEWDYFAKHSFSGVRLKSDQNDQG